MQQHPPEHLPALSDEEFRQYLLIAAASRNETGYPDTAVHQLIAGGEPMRAIQVLQIELGAVSEKLAKAERDATMGWRSAAFSGLLALGLLALVLW